MMTLEGWGRYPRVEGSALLPATPGAASALVGSELIPRGRARSYGDSAIAPLVLQTDQWRHFLGFDESSGLLQCQAGVTLGDILSVFASRGWFLPVTPGTQFVSVGGAIASDVHGKNHHLDGCFSRYVEHLDLLLADGCVVRCSRTERPELFRATCGGMGLTGVVVSAAIRLRRVDSAWVEQTTYKAANLREVLTLFEEHHGSTYSVAWIDCLAGGQSLGRSLLMIGEHARDGDLVDTRKPVLSVPVDLPGAVLNPYTMQLFNALYYGRVRESQSHQRVSYQSFFYPLDSLHNWNRIYGRQGFVQYQFVIPREAGLTGMTEILQRIAASRKGSFLAVLKAFGPGNDNYLSFPMEGYTLALDFKLERGLFDLLDEVDELVLGCGGRLYLAKDARMSEATFKASYPEWERFQSIRESVGALGAFASHQSYRLGLDR